MQRTYEKNAELIKDLYNSCFGEKYKKQPFFKYMIDAMYSDPDKFDEELRTKAKTLTSRFGIEFGADGICGWKLLFDLYDGNDSDNWVEVYKKIRKSSIGTVFWPCKKNGGNTINVERSIEFGDRIDLTLYDIKRYIKEIKTRMKFENKDTRDFLDRYKKEDGFREFVNDFNLTMFVTDDDRIYDLVEEDYENKFIDDDKCDNFPRINRFGSKRKKEILGNYIENILKIVEQSV